MTTLRRPVAQVLLVAIIGLVFLPWLSSDVGDVSGSELGEGRLMIIVCAITLVAVQARFRPAWIGGGLAFAIAVRELTRADDQFGRSAGIGLWLATALALAAVVLLLWDLAASLDRSPTEPLV